MFLFFSVVFEESQNPFPFYFDVLGEHFLLPTLLFLDFGIARKKTLPRHPHRLSKLWSNMARQKITTFCLNVL